MPRITHPRCKSPLTKKSKRKRGRDDSCMTETSHKKVKEEPDSDSAKVGKPSYRPVVGEFLKMHKRWEYVSCKSMICHICILAAIKALNYLIYSFAVTGKPVPGRIGSCYLFCWTRGEEGFSHWLTSDIPEKVATDCKLYDEKPLSAVERSTKFVASLVDGPEDSPTREYSIFTKVEQGIKPCMSMPYQ